MTSRTILSMMRRMLRCIKKYAALAEKQKNVLFGGRLGQYKYYDMDKVILAALEMAQKEK